MKLMSKLMSLYKMLETKVCSKDCKSDEEEIENCQKIKPIIYRRGEFTLSKKFKKFIGKLHDS